MMYITGHQNNSVFSGDDMCSISGDDVSLILTLLAALVAFFCRYFVLTQADKNRAENPIAPAASGTTVRDGEIVHRIVKQSGGINIDKISPTRTHKASPEPSQSHVIPDTSSGDYNSSSSDSYSGASGDC